jgi:hypothetical protein
MHTKLSENPEKIFLPVQRSAFENPDRDLIQQYDNSKLSQADASAFKRMGLITSRELAPGPTVLVKTKKTIGGNLSLGASLRASLERSVSSPKKYTLIKGRKETIDYRKLQKPKYDQLNLD